MRTGRDVAIAALLGAEEFGFCSSVLVVSGCVMLRHCQLNNCSVGIATQDEALQKRFGGKPEYIVNYFNFITQELREIMASLGIRTINEMIGRADLIEVNKEIIPSKARGVNYSKILYVPELPRDYARYCKVKQESGLDFVLDKELIKMCGVFKENEPIKISVKINNTDRTAGAMLSGELIRRYGEAGLPHDSIVCKFKGIAGQSFGAFLAKGITFELEGMANDYVGKGISGGKIIIYPDKQTGYKAEENIIIGNTAFYGAIAGEAYIGGVAGERFCIRNSGLKAVVEGVGDHGCEYMTGGYVAIIGKTGRNFAAGMSGGIAYVYNAGKDFNQKCNLEMVELEILSQNDEKVLYDLLCNHHKYTQSAIAKKIIEHFKKEIKHFVKVMPTEYKRILAGKKAIKKPDLVEVSDG